VRRSWGLALLLAACMPAKDIDTGDVTMAPPELGSTLNVRVDADSVRFELHVTNATTRVVGVEFASAQRHDFEVVAGTGQRVWRWSDQYAFGQATGREDLSPGESRLYRASWAPGDRSGEHVVIGRLVSTNLPVELSTAVELR
jgi:hypothetical protein